MNVTVFAFVSKFHVVFLWNMQANRIRWVVHLWCGLNVVHVFCCCRVLEVFRQWIWMVWIKCCWSFCIGVLGNIWKNWWFLVSELLRENKRMLDKSIREIERERQGLQTQEKKLITEIKKSAKQGQMVNEIFYINSVFLACRFTYVLLYSS